MLRKPEPKAQAKLLAKELAQLGLDLKHGQALNLVAKLNGFKGWNEMAAATPTASSASPALANDYLLALMEAVVWSADDAGCSDDLTVVSASAIEALSEATDTLRAGKTPEDPATRTSISTSWSVHDVRSLRPDLSEEDAYHVLWLACRKYFDASLGVNWDVLESHAFDAFKTWKITGILQDKSGDIPVVVKLSTGQIYAASNPDCQLDGCEGDFTADGDDGSIGVTEGLVCGGLTDELADYADGLRERNCQVYDLTRD